MLNEEDFSYLTLEVTTEYESEWQKIDKAIANIKLGDLKTEFSLPVEISESIDELPRRVLRSGQGYSILMSSKKIAFHLSVKAPKTYAIPPEEKALPPRAEVLREGESNFNLFLGVFLGARANVVESVNVKLAARFEVPLEEHIVGEIEFPLLEKLKSQKNGFTFGLAEIMVLQESSDKKLSYEILEDLEKNLLKIDFVKRFKTLPTTIELTRLVQGSIKECNEFLTTLKE
jgi:hypothetical protein